MTTCLAANAVFAVNALRIGPLRLSVYGLCAAIGLMLAMAFARRLARSVGADPEAIWDAGLFAILSCFLASRLLLVLRDPVAFLHYPLLVLGLPSLTLGGMAVAALAVWVYLRRKGLDVWQAIDVYAAPSALLAVFLELGHALDGSELGMPSNLPWAVREPALSASPSTALSASTSSALRFHPVALYGVGAALLLAVVLWRAILSRHRAPGQVAASGFVAGGATAFGLDMVTQPVPALVNLWIEPGQWVAIAAMLGGAILFSTRGCKPDFGLPMAAVQPTPETTPRHTEVH